jgi:hypothetical protein
MKKLVIFLCILFTGTLFCSGQNIAPAPADKAVVYFVRTSSLGFAINFSYFDSTKLIGKFNGPKYLRYECEPGHHLFWARSENKDFIEADLEAGKIYFIEATPKMGMVKAGVELKPVDPKDEKKMEKVMKLLTKKTSETFTAEELALETKNMEEVVTRGMEKYKEDKEKGKSAGQLHKNMFYTAQ